MSQSQTLTMRIETILDRWNKMPSHGARAAFSSRVTSVSVGLAELERVHRELTKEVTSLEADLDAALSSTEPPA